MKTTVPYNFKKAILFGALVALPFAFAGCEKENTTPNNNGGNGGTNPGGGTQPQKHNVELKYDGRTNAGCVNVAMDTIYKYNANPTVDTIFMIPDPIDQFATSGSQSMANVVKYLRERHNVNPKKVFGKGDIVINDIVTNNHPEILKFFADTLRYNVRNN